MSLPKKSYQMNDLRKPYLVSLTFKYASSVANSNCFYGITFFINVQDRYAKYGTTIMKLINPF